MSAIPKAIRSDIPSFRLLIDGTLTAGAATLDVLNPATGKLLATCARADKAQLHAAVEAARKAFPAWSGASIETRRQALLKMADGLEARAAEFARLLTQEQGKPLTHATEEIG
jgi:acyl-CoA reductase-like NAD-dependent aldehyde dehydrogenase